MTQIPVAEELRSTRSQTTHSTRPDKEALPAKPLSGHRNARQTPARGKRNPPSDHAAAESSGRKSRSAARLSDTRSAAAFTESRARWA